MAFAQEDLECTDANKIDMLIRKGIMTKETCFNIAGNELTLKILGQTYQLADIDPKGDNSIKDYESLCTSETITNNLSQVVDFSKEKKLSDLSQAEASFIRFGQFVQALKLEFEKVAKLTDIEGSKKISISSTGYADGVRVFVGSSKGYKLDAGIYQWLKELKSSGGKDEFDHVYVDPEVFKVAACNILNIDLIKDHALFKNDEELQKLSGQTAQFHIQHKYLDSPRNYFIAYNRAKNLSNYVSQYIGEQNIERNEIIGKISKSLQTGRNMCRGYCTMRRGAKLNMTLPGQHGQITTYLPQEGEANPVYNSPLSGDHAKMDKIAIQTLVNDFSNYLIAEQNTPEVERARNFFRRIVHVNRNGRNFLLRNTKNISADSMEFKKLMVGLDKDGKTLNSDKKKNYKEIFDKLYIKEIEVVNFESEIENINNLFKKFLIKKNGDLARNLFEGSDYDGSLPEDASFFNATKRLYWQNVYNIDYDLGVPRAILYGHGLTRVPRSGIEDDDNAGTKITFEGHALSEQSLVDFFQNYFMNYKMTKNPKNLATKFKGFRIKTNDLKAAIEKYKEGSIIKVATIHPTDPSKNDKFPIDYKLTSEDIGMLNTLKSTLDPNVSEEVSLLQNFGAIFANDIIIKSRPFSTRLLDVEYYVAKGVSNPDNVYFQMMYKSLHQGDYKFEVIKPTLMRILGIILKTEGVEFINDEKVSSEKHKATPKLLLEVTQSLRGMVATLRTNTKKKEYGKKEKANSLFYKSPFKSDNGADNVASTIYSLLDYRNAYAKILNDSFDPTVDKKTRIFPAYPDDFLEHEYNVKHSPSKFGKIVESQMLPIKDYVNLTKIYFRPNQFYSRNPMITNGSKKNYHYRHYHADGRYGKEPNKYDKETNKFEALGVFHPRSQKGCNTGTFFYNISDVDIKYLDGQLTEQYPTSPIASRYKLLDRTKFHYFSRMMSADHSMLPEGMTVRRSNIIQAWDKSFHAVDDFYPVPKFNLIKTKHPITYVIPGCGQCNCLKTGKITGDKLEQLLNGSLELNFYSDYKWIVENPDVELPESIALKEFVTNKTKEHQVTFASVMAKQGKSMPQPFKGKDICLYSPLVPQSHNAGSGGGEGNLADHDESEAESVNFCPIIDALKTMPTVSGVSGAYVQEVKKVCFEEVASFPMNPLKCVTKEQDVCTFLPPKYAGQYPVGSAKCKHKALNIDVADQASFNQWMANYKASDQKPAAAIEGNLCKLLTTKFDKDGNPQ